MKRAASVASGADIHREWRDLLGDTRYGSLRAHCSAFEAILKVDRAFIPWNHQKIAALLNILREEESTPQKVQRLWKSIKWGSDAFGLLNPEEVRTLATKKDAVRNDLVTTVLAPQRRANTPQIEDIMALERGATFPGPLGDQYAAAIFRFQAGCSGRYDDIQHTQPGTFKLTGDTIEFTAWQTKVTGPLTQQRPMPLIAVLHSFSGSEWWHVIMKTQKTLARCPDFKDMDYLLPTPTKCRTGLIARPCGRDKALRWMRLILASQLKTQLPQALRLSGGHQDKAIPQSPDATDLTPVRAALATVDAQQMDTEPRQKPLRVAPTIWTFRTAAEVDAYVRRITLPSLRVWLADLAYQAGVSRENRRYIGRWASESTADTYTREHRTVIKSIWATVTEVPIPPSRSVPVDLQHQDWGLSAPAPQQQPEVVDADADFIIVKPIEIDAFDEPAEPIPVRIMADLVQPALGGPLTVGMNMKRTGKNHKFMVHLFKTSSEAIGCSWRPRPDQWTVLSNLDYHNEPAEYQQCRFCFRLHDFPKTWSSVSDAASKHSATSDSEGSDQSLLDSENDTASDEEAVRL